jgi:hypothetical protein
MPSTLEEAKEPLPKTKGEDHEYSKSNEGLGFSAAGIKLFSEY